MIVFASLIVLLLVFGASAKGQIEDTVSADIDLEQINRELDNPLSRQWSLVFQENLNVKTGDLLEN